MLDARWLPATPILLYHRFDPREATSLWTVTTDVFKSQLQRLKDDSRPVVRLRTIIDGLRDPGAPVPARAVAITADDGDRSVYTEMFPLLRRYGAHATLFVNTFSISRSPGTVTWEQLQEMHYSGLVDVQFHTLSHTDFEFERKRRSPAEYESLVDFELHYSRDWIETRLRCAVDMLAWPYGYYDHQLEEIASRSGYLAAFSNTKRALDDDSIFSVPRRAVFNRHRGGGRFSALLDGTLAPGVAMPDIASNTDVMQMLKAKNRPAMRLTD